MTTGQQSIDYTTVNPVALSKMIAPAVRMSLSQQSSVANQLWMATTALATELTKANTSLSIQSAVDQALGAVMKGGGEILSGASSLYAAKGENDYRKGSNALEKDLGGKIGAQNKIIGDTNAALKDNQSAIEDVQKSTSVGMGATPEALAGAEVQRQSQLQPLQTERSGLLETKGGAQSQKADLTDQLKDGRKNLASKRKEVSDYAQLGGAAFRGMGEIGGAGFQASGQIASSGQQMIMLLLQNAYKAVEQITQSLLQDLQQFNPGQATIAALR